MNEQHFMFPFWQTLTVVVLVAIGGYLYFAYKTPAPITSGDNGKVYVSISDASADLRNVSDVAMTVDKVELHSATRGWVTVSGDSNTFNLLTLKANGKSELAGSASVAADTYNQVRATISKVEVKTKSTGTKAAVLASTMLTITGNVVVKANESSRANIDVQTSDSLHITAKGEYVFTPVVVFESRHGVDVQVSSDNSVVVSGGTVDTSITAGVDLSGNVNVGSALSPNVQIDIVGGVPVMLKGGTNSSGSGLIQIDGSTNSSNSQTSASSSLQINGSSGGGVNFGY